MLRHGDGVEIKRLNQCTTTLCHTVLTATNTCMVKYMQFLQHQYNTGQKLFETCLFPVWYEVAE